MDGRMSLAEFEQESGKEKFIAKNLLKLDSITLMAVLEDVMLRRIFLEFIKKINCESTDFETVKLMRRYVLCQKIILKKELFEEDDIYCKLLKICPNFLWQQRIKALTHRCERDINFLYVLEKLKWESVIELICHDDYRKFLMAIKTKSTQIREILGDTYRKYYF